MEELLKDVRGLTRKERKDLAKEGIYLLSVAPEETEKVMFKLMDMVFGEDERLDNLTFKEEEELINKIVELTYALNLEDAKN